MADVPERGPVSMEEADRRNLAWWSDRIAQIVMNLTDNAVRNTEAGRVDVHIGLHQADSADAADLEIRVTDTGPGIPLDQQEAVFSAFTQVDAGGDGMRDGLGLGLSIVKSITEMLGGSVSLRSRLGEGSTFRVLLPVEIADGAAPQEASHESAGGSQQVPARQGAHVLIAEDEAINRMYLEQLLKDRGWTTTSVGDSERALESARGQAFDLILTDLSMPKLGGLEFTGRLRRLEEETGRRRTPVIALTAHARDATKRECDAATVDGFVTKPFRENELFDEIDRVLNPAD